MPSPFPGMNPYLERAAVWPDFHCTFTTYLRTALTEQISPSYFAAIRHHEFEGHLSRKERRKIPYIAVEGGKTEEVVTVVGMIGPGVKAPGEVRDLYLARRREWVDNGTNIVELDFRRGGQRVMPACEILGGYEYHTMVTRVLPQSETYPSLREEGTVVVNLCPFRLREPIPQLSIPLRDGAAAATVDLQAVLHQTYDGAAYHWWPLYNREPEPPLTAEEAEWALQILAVR